MTNRDPLYYEGEGTDLANEMRADALAERESELGPEGPEDDWPHNWLPPWVKSTSSSQPPDS